MLLALLFASFGVATIVLLANSVVRTAVAPADFLKEALLVQVSGPSRESVLKEIARVPGVDAVVPSSQLFLKGRLLDLDVWFPIQLLADEKIPEVLARYQARVVEGALPGARSNELLVPVGFAKSRGMKIGDLVGGPGDFTSHRLKISGLLEGPYWVGVASAGVLGEKGSFDSALVFTPGPRQKEVEVAIRSLYPPPVVTADIDRSLLASQATAGGAVVAQVATPLVVVHHWAPTSGGQEKEVDLNYRGDLQLILLFIVGINSTVLSFISGLLALLYFRQRRSEFVLLSVLGRSKPALLRRVITESTFLVGLGWILGVCGAVIFTTFLSQVLLAGRGVIIQTLDVEAALFTLPLAVLSLLSSFIVIATAFVRFDPIRELEERG